MYVFLAIFLAGPLGVALEEVLAHHAFRLQDHLLHHDRRHPPELHVVEPLELCHLLREGLGLGGAGRGRLVGRGGGALRVALGSAGEQGLVAFGLDVPQLLVVEDLLVELVLLYAAEVELLVEELDVFELDHAPLAGLAALAVDGAFLLADELGDEGGTQ